MSRPKRLGARKANDDTTTERQTVEPMLLRRRETAVILGVSESQVFKWERAGILPVVVIPGIRAVRNLASDVRSLARNIGRGILKVGDD